MASYFEVQELNKEEQYSLLKQDWACVWKLIQSMDHKWFKVSNEVLDGRLQRKISVTMWKIQQKKLKLLVEGIDIMI